MKMLHTKIMWRLVKGSSLIGFNRFRETSITNSLVNKQFTICFSSHCKVWNVNNFISEVAKCDEKLRKCIILQHYITRKDDRPVISWSRQFACATEIVTWLYRRKCLSCNYQTSSCICTFIGKKDTYLNVVLCISEEIHTIYHQNSHCMYGLWWNANFCIPNLYCN
jgi:hypothetical protein